MRTRKGQWLLALLALRHPRSVDRAWLAEMLWPDSLEPLHNLRQCLADLRAALGPEAGRLMSPSGHTLGLDLSGDASVDALEFDAVIRRGDLHSLETAVSQGSRVFLEDCREEWAAAERLPRELAYLSALETLAQAAASQKEYAVATNYLRQAVTRDPMRESARRALMQSLAAEGSLSAAQQVYHDLRALLRREMNTEPDGETTALFQRLRAQAAPPASPAVPAATRPLPPASLTRLVGREQELRDITIALISARLVTLTGTGGIGKTLLARHTAESLPEQWPDGVWFADLAPLNHGSAIAATVAAAVVPEKSGEDPEASLRRYLRERHGLLLLDNCEHLTAQCAALARTLLQSCPRLRLLATSREPLAVEGETLYRVPSLAVDDAVRLFTERATAAGVGFVLTDTNRDAVQTICRRLDGIPLALELAAARVPVLSPAQIAARLDERFHLLTQGSRAALPRQQTLRSAVDWSYDLLSPPEQILFRRLSVFSGGWTVDAAEAVCAGGPVGLEDVIDLLAALGQKSLLVSDRQGENVRFRYLETIRQYAGRKLEEHGEAQGIASSHAAYFLKFAEEPKANARLSAREWIDGWNTDHDNLRAALRRLLADPDAGDKPLRFVAALDDFWHTEGHWKEARAWFTKALAHPGSQERTNWRARVLTAAGHTARVQGDNARAQELLEESRAIWDALGDQEGLAMALGALGQTARMRGDYVVARSCHEESLRLFRAARLSYGIINALFNLSSVASIEGDLEKAQALSEECLALARVANDRHTAALCLYNLGRVAALQQEPARARPLLESSLTLQRELGSKHEIPTMLVFLADVVSRQGDVLAARAYLRESLTAAHAMGDRRVVAYAVNGAAELAQKEGNWKRAVCLLSAATALSGDIGAPLVPATQGQCEGERQELRLALGEAEFEAAWLEGQAMTVDQAVTRTLAALSES